MNHIEQYLSDRLNERAIAGNMRSLKTQRAPVDFFSNDYLGLATSGLLYTPSESAPTSYYSGSTGSRLLSGNSAEAEELEEIIATFHNAKAALLFNSGYDANVGLIASITSRHTTILSDELCHASLIDGIRLSQCTRKYKFGHNDLNELEEKLQKAAGNGPIIVVTESVFSMDGDTAPLAEMMAICELYGAQLIVDEAHATGVFGPSGKGLVCALGLEERVFARIHTFGKALGCHGAAVVGSTLLKQYLVNFARTFIYTTALPLHSIDTATAAYRYLSSTAFSNDPLHQVIAYFRGQAAATGMAGWKESNSAIQALITGGNEHTRQMASALQSAGLQVNPILHPTVPVGMERLRICLHSFNTREQVDTLIESIKAHTS